MVTKKILVNLCIASLFIASSTQVLASAFQSFEQNASGLGNAYAGMAVNDNNDASTEFSNPAAMTLLKKPEIDVSTVVVDAHSQYTATGATNIVDQNIINVGTRRSYPLGANPLPAIHYVQPLTQRLFFGFGITVPFGLETDYPKHSVARYFATKSKIMTINIGPSIAYKISRFFSIGGGLSLQYIKAELDQQIDFGKIIPTPLNSTSLSTDGSLDNTASDWGWGSNFGILFHINQSTRAGLTYRSPIFYSPTGSAKINYGSLSSEDIEIAKEKGIVSSKNISTKMVMPEMIIFSLFRAFGSHWQSMGTVSWTRWNRFRKLNIHFHNQIPNAEVHEDFHNTMRYAIGLNYLLNRWWTFRVGFAFDNSPTDNSHRTTRLPDADRTWYSLGLQYAILKSLKLNLGYSYIHIGDGYVHETFPPTGATLDAHFDHSYAHLFGLQIDWLV